MHFSDNRRKTPLVPHIEIQEDLSSLSLQLISIINKERDLRSLPPLQTMDYLNEMAISHASYLVGTGQFSHYGYRGANPDERHIQFGGSGKINEIIEGFFAQRDPVTQETVPLNPTSELAHQLMDALLESTDKKEIIFDPIANLLGLAFIVSPDNDQLAVVIETVTDYASISALPTDIYSQNVRIAGKVTGGHKLAWIGVARAVDDNIPPFETEVSGYFPPLDQVIYVDKKGKKFKTGAQIGALVLGTIAAPFTYGTSLVVADLMMRQIASTYRTDDVEVKGGVNADIDGRFAASIPIGNKGPGLYYITIWGSGIGNDDSEDKPSIVARQVVRVQ